VMTLLAFTTGEACVPAGRPGVLNMGFADDVDGPPPACCACTVDKDVLRLSTGLQGAEEVGGVRPVNEGPLDGVKTGDDPGIGRRSVEPRTPPGVAGLIGAGRPGVLVACASMILLRSTLMQLSDEVRQNRSNPRPPLTFALPRR
jgi:hypothetical protein